MFSSERVNTVPGMKMLFVADLHYALKQYDWLVANAAHTLGMETYQAVLGSIALLLVAAALAFRLLPAPRR